MKIGIFGGTFNPIHNCHLRIAKQVWRRMKLDRVVFVPSGHPPHKPEAMIQAPQNRLTLVRLAIADSPYFDLSDQEVSRSGKSYAIETVEAFRQQYPGAEIFFILGVDAFLEIDSWRDVERLIRICHFVVVSRQGFSFQQLEKLKRPIQADTPSLLALDRGRIRKKEILLKSGKTLFLLKLPPCPISSTQVREQLKARQDMKNLLPESVKSYILKNRLYQD
jgi:nicotinate-nucleotide adenylyltransferase